MNYLRPLRKEIEGILEKEGFDKKKIKIISDIITEYSVLEKRGKDKIVFVPNKEELKEFLEHSILEKIPDEKEVDISSTYLISMAIRDEQKSQASKMDELIEEMEKIHAANKEDIFIDKADKAVELLLYTDKIPEEIKMKILKRIEKLNRKIKELDRRIHVSTEKFYKDPLTEFFSNKFYDEMISDSVLLKRKEDVVLYEAFTKKLQEIKDKAVMFVDFANFKLANEVIGHNEADKILVKFAEMFKDEKNIIPIRRGGDEFVFIAEKGILEKYKRKMENLDYLLKTLNPEKLVKNNVIIFPSAGIETISFLDKIRQKKISSLDEANSIKKQFSLAIKKAEIKSNENKIVMKKMLNQPLTREDAIKKSVEIKHQIKDFDR